jgi:hypothetical protein
MQQHVVAAILPGKTLPVHQADGHLQWAQIKGQGDSMVTK